MPQAFTEGAFPLLKPDMDVFGVPRRSRKQRGWYQVARPFPDRPSARLGTRTYRQPAVEPSDVPPELFDNILGYLTASGDKRAVARCALVCRYWAKKCQQMVLRRLVLRSREDAVLLLEHMKSPKSAITSFAQSLEVPVAQKVSSMPWLYLVPDISDRAHMNYLSYSVSLEGPLPPRQRMRSIHHGLPRSYPRFSRRIVNLSLAGIHFEKLDDLIHLVWEMPHLVSLDCKRVTWGSLPTTVSRRKPKNISVFDGQAPGVYLSQCSPCPLEASGWLCTSVWCKSHAFFSLDDLARFLALAQALEKGAATKVGTHLYGNYFRECKTGN